MPDHLTPGHRMQWHPVPDITVELLSFCHFINRLHQPQRYEGYATRRPMVFSPSDFTDPFLCPEELEQVNGFKSLKKQIEWMTGRRLVKEMVRREVNPASDLRDITIAYHEQGAPFLPRFSHLPISISHSGEYAAVALSRNRDIRPGMDLEKIKSMPDAGFMNLAFTPTEIKSLGNDSIQVFRSWTLKEAFLKYIQKGFNESLQHVEILGDTICHRKVPCPVKCLTATIGDRYFLSLVLGPGPTLQNPTACA